MTSLWSALTFAQRVAFDDGFGNSVSCWIDRFTTRASITPLTENGAILAAWLAGTRVVTIRIRQSPECVAVGADWKATDLDSGVAFNIHSIADPHEGEAEEGRWLDLVGDATERVAAARNPFCSEMAGDQGPGAPAGQ
jgi:hypothetical protein